LDRKLQYRWLPEWKQALLIQGIDVGNVLKSEVSEMTMRSAAAGEARGSIMSSLQKYCFFLASSLLHAPRQADVCLIHVDGAPLEVTVGKQ
jgi:hypothetical protein